MKEKKRNGLPLREFIKQELKDSKIRAYYNEAAIEWQVARKVSEARKQASLTQAGLARKLCTTQQAVSRIEAGEQNTTVEMLWRIAQATGISFDVTFQPGVDRATYLGR